MICCYLTESDTSLSSQSSDVRGQRFPLSCCPIINFRWSRPNHLVHTSLANSHLPHWRLILQCKVPCFLRSSHSFSCSLTSNESTPTRLHMGSGRTVRGWPTHRAVPLSGAIETLFHAYSSAAGHSALDIRAQALDWSIETPGTSNIRVTMSHLPLHLIH